jgi:hypothetical protein
MQPGSAAVAPAAERPGARAGVRGAGLFEPVRAATLGAVVLPHEARS